MSLEARAVAISDKLALSPDQNLSGRLDYPLQEGTGNMPLRRMKEFRFLKRHHSHSRWLDWNSPRSAWLVSLMSGVAFGICIAVGVLFVLKNTQQRRVALAPTHAAGTGLIPARDTVEIRTEAHSAPSIGGETAMSASDNDRSSWSLQLIGDSSEAKALEEYRNLQKRFPVILGSRTPVVVKRKLGGRGSVFWYQVRLTEDSRERATALCIQLKSAGGKCLVHQPLNAKTKPTFKPNDDVTDPTALKRLLGLSLVDMSIDLRKRYKIANRFEGVVITNVNGGLPTIAKSLLPGDVIVEVAGEPVTSSDDFWIKLDRLGKAGRESALLTVARGGGNLRLVPLSLTRP
jgi:hypothetical protein